MKHISQVLGPLMRKLEEKRREAQEGTKEAQSEAQDHGGTFGCTKSFNGAARENSKDLGVSVKGA